MNTHDMQAMQAFFAQADESGQTNAQKAERLHKVIRRVETTSKDKSYEEAESAAGQGAGAAGRDAATARDAGAEGVPAPALPVGVVEVDGKLVGLGIHILNEDVYPLQSFEIYLRNCELTGDLDISGCRDMVFLDVYHNRIGSIECADMPSMRILGLQDNRIARLDPTGLPACQGIDAGKNLLCSIDVSRNAELVELYVNDNQLTEIDLSANAKLKYFYCHNNRIAQLDTRANPLLRHLNATDNPMMRIRCLAPQREERLPLELTAREGGFVGMKFAPIYNAQWKETGEWMQAYYAYPCEGRSFDGWFDEQGALVSREQAFEDEYGASRVLEARFL